MTVVVIGAGHSGVQAAESLRMEGYADRIVLLDKADHLPYQRPRYRRTTLRSALIPRPCRCAVLTFTRARYRSAVGDGSHAHRQRGSSGVR